MIVDNNGNLVYVNTSRMMTDGERTVKTSGESDNLRL